MERKFNQLTRGEEEIMQIVWQLGNASVSEVIRLTREPRPKYTTVATFLKILETKGFLRHVPEGKRLRYFPVVPREEYAHGAMSTMLTNYFGGSLAQLVSFFARNEKLSTAETEEILDIMRNAGK